MPDLGPQAAGRRVGFDEAPAALRGWAATRLGAAVVEAVTQPLGFSPGVAVRLRGANGRRLFLKAVSAATNVGAVAMHRREASVLASLPNGVPVPRLVDLYDDGTWVGLLLDDVEGVSPRLPWRRAELSRVLDTVAELHATLTPSPAGPPDASSTLRALFDGWRSLAGAANGPPPGLDPWAVAHLDWLAATEMGVGAAVAGDTLLHCDLRADNVLLASGAASDRRTWIVDWPHAAVGAAWVDAVLMAPSVTMQGGPPPEEVVATAGPDPDALLTVVVGVAGFFIQRSLQPAPPELPTLRAFQAAQGAVALAWARRLQAATQSHGDHRP